MSKRGVGTKRKPKRCGTCGGRGFVFDSIPTPTNKTMFGLPVLEDKGIKITCTGCFGKGEK